MSLDLFQPPNNLSVNNLRIPDPGKSTHQLTHLSSLKITFALLGSHPALGTRRGQQATKREGCRWCGKKPKQRRGYPEPIQARVGRTEAAAGTGGLGAWDMAQGARMQAGGRCLPLQPPFWGHFPAAASQPPRSKQSQRCRCRHCTRLGNGGRLYLSMLSSH